MNTRSYVYALAAAFSVSFVVAVVYVANAQQPPQPPFEPYTITAQEHQAIINFLGDVPSKYANPILNQLGQLEQQAQQKKSIEAAKAKTEAEKAKDTPIEKPKN